MADSSVKCQFEQKKSTASLSRASGGPFRSLCSERIKCLLEAKIILPKNKFGQSLQLTLPLCVWKGSNLDLRLR